MQLRIYLAFLLLLFFEISSRAQSSCVNIAPVPPICQGGSALLKATLATGCFNGSNSYTFAVQPAYTPEPFTGGTAVDPSFTNCTTGGNHDDCWAGPFDIGFQFCFFNHLYSQFWVGSNGWISFSGPPNTSSPSWCTYTSTIIPNAGADIPKNAIFAPWEDWFPSLPTGTQNVFYYTSGVTPNMKLVVYWINCRLFSCSSNPAIQGTFQIVLNEQGGVIDNHIQEKPACFNYNATQGVQNIDGTIAFTATGRNNTQWIASNESTRFTPSGVTWYEGAYPGGPIAGYGSEITVTPAVTTTYFCEVETCNNTPEVQQVTVIVLPHPTITGAADVCDGATTAYATEAGMTNYVWAVVGGTITSGGTGNHSATVLWNVPTGVHTISVNYDDPVSGCIGLTPTLKTIYYHIPATPVISGSSDPCQNAPGYVYTTLAGNANYQWVVSPNGVVTGGGTITDNTVTVTWPTASAGSVSVNYMDIYGCTSATPGVLNIFPRVVPVLTTANPQMVCTGSTINITLTSNNPDPRVAYSWPEPLCVNIASGCPMTGGTDNFINLSPVLSGSAAGTITFAITPSLLSCLGPVANFIVNVNPLPSPTLNGITDVCLNSTGNIYTTEAGMTNYNWIVNGGSVTSGGGPADNTVTVTWNSAGPQAVRVNYNDPVTGCTGVSPTTSNITVHSLPIPSFTAGPTGVCLGIPGHVYTTEAGMTGYVWNVTGGSITAGGTATSNSATVTWNTAGTGTISVNYTDANGCTAASATALPVTVNPLPAPNIIGSAVVCNHSTGNVYTTEGGKTAYIWTITGGTITLGGTPTDNTATVTWNTAGAQSISVNYLDGNSCTAVSPTTYNVTVNPLPIPSFTGGDNAVCIGTPGHVYTTNAGKANYAWSIVGGMITSGGSGTDNTATVTWNTLGAQSISVNYADPVTLCSALAPTPFTVTVNSLPSPTISGTTAVCNNSSHVYTTEAGMTGYVWTITGGSITSGGTATSNSATVTWNTAGPGTISVNYLNQFSCTALTPTSYAVTVNALPVPTVTGPGAMCLNNPATYSTETSMTGYTWTVTGGTITAGPGTNTVDILWNTLGNHPVTVTYIDANGCTPTMPTTYTVQVNNLPVPALNGPAAACLGFSSTYTTDAGLSNYVWHVSAGGTIVGPANTSSITVLWSATGAQTVDVNYTVGTGCTAASPTLKNITVYPSPSPVITGLASPCGQTIQTYTIGASQANHAYNWTVSGGTPTSGTASSITVTWGNANPATISMTEAITYAPGVVCSSTAPTFSIALGIIPDAATAITGSPNVCQGWTRSYSVSPIANADSYSWWYVPSTGVTIGNSGPNASITFDLTASAGNLFVKGNKTGCASGSASPPYAIGVHPAPYVSITACNDPKTTSTSRPFALKGGVPPGAGGQYLLDGIPVSGGMLDPSTLSTTTHLISYTYMDVNTCVNTSSSVPITVVNGSVLTSCPTSFTDPRDNKTYRALSMGTRCWMVDNLTYGTILSPSDVPQQNNCTPEKYCLTSDPACSSYGGLYQWDELMQYQVPSAGVYVQGLCPPEWHVPTAAEWQLLIDGALNPGNGLAGAELKDPLPTFGFKALLKGIYYQNALWDFTSGSLTATMFWTAAPAGTTRALARGLNIYETSVSKYYSGRSNAFPVRCVKD